MKKLAVPAFTVFGEPRYDCAVRAARDPGNRSRKRPGRRRAESEVRVPQPYEIFGTEGHGDDLFATLLRELADPDGAQIRFVIGGLERVLNC